ncbi:ExeA family protein [Glaciimonas sp. GG7]
MYKNHFSLRESPFGITPDTGFFYPCSSYQIALNTLLIATNSGEGFIKITGEVGTGKTMLCRKFMATLDDSFVTAYIPNPSHEPRTLMLALAEELKITLIKDVDQHALMSAINRRLIVLADCGKKVVLCLDEAQALPLESLEALRLLTNLETEKRKLLQIVLFGQPELNLKLQKNAIRQLAQRITFQYAIAPLTRADMTLYIYHRLHIAGFTGGALFTSFALRRLYKASGGIPRLVNILAHKSLMVAYGEGVQQVRWSHVRVAAKDTLPHKNSALLWMLGAGAACVVAVLGMAWGYFK